MTDYKQKTKLYYAKLAKTYPKEVSKWRLDLLDEYNSPQKAILELGCGTGNYLLRLPNRRVVGIDLSKESIAVLKKRPDFKKNRINVVLGDILDMPFKDNNFDVAYSFSTLYYIKELPLALKEISRVLKRGGVGIFEFGNKYSLNMIWDKFMFSDVPQFFWSENQLRRMAYDAGFEIKKVLYRQIIPDFFKMFDKWYITSRLWQKISFRFIFIVEKK